MSETAVATVCDTVVQYSTTSLEAGRLISAVQPYGTEDFGQVGGRLGLSLDHRDRPGYPTRGALVQAEARAFPGVWGVRSVDNKAGLIEKAEKYLWWATRRNNRIRLSGEGESGESNAARGDLYCVIRVKQHPFFQRDGNDLVCQIPISFSIERGCAGCSAPSWQS